MLNLKDFYRTNMGKAILELNDKLEEEDMPVTKLNIVGGFALMMQGLRDPESNTDLDYVGRTKSKKFNQIAEEIGFKYNLGRDWINNDIMLSGTTVKDFEMASGKLHFIEVINLPKLNIKILEENDLLRMKIIAIDTSYSAVLSGGDFSRLKDIPDTAKLMDKLNITTQTIPENWKEYIMNKATTQIIDIYNKKGLEAVSKAIDIKKNKVLQKQQSKIEQNTPKESSPFIKNLLSNLMNQNKETDDKEYE